MNPARTVIERLIAKAEAGDHVLLERMARRAVARRAGGNVTVLPYEAAAADYLAGRDLQAGFQTAATGALRALLAARPEGE